MERPPISFAQLLRRLRVDARLTQEQLAGAAGLSVRTIHDLELGLEQAVGDHDVGSVADALNLEGSARVRFEIAARERAKAGVMRQDSQVGGMAAATRTLPRDSASFTGREAELRDLIFNIKDVSRSGGVVGIHAISGMAGIGKTAFAVHAAHQLAAQFPDGQIFLPLHGHTPGQRPVDPADALASLLLAAGVAAQQIPPDFEARVQLWRDYLAGKRILVVLDDAVSHGQVQPLLPGTVGSLALVTSRRRLTGLENARTIGLDVLSAGEAAELLIRVAARPELDNQNAAVQKIIHLCGNLPLAVGMLGAQLHHHPAWTAEELAADLAAAHDRLTLMAVENLSVAAAFDLSYLDLTLDQQRLFRRLGVHPGVEVDAYAAAALNDSDLTTAKRHLEALYEQHLITEPVRGRYRLHDLIREYARILAAAERTPESDAAFGRLLNYYQQTARAADRYLARRTLENGPDVASALRIFAPDFSSREDAIAWMDAERLNLQAVADRAASHDALKGQAAAIASAMHGFLRSEGHWDQARILHGVALETARSTGDRLAEARALIDLGTIQQVTGNYSAATASLTQALDLHGDLDDRLGKANALSRLGVVQYLTGDYTAATASLAQALDLHRCLGNQLGEANALNDMGIVHYLIGDYPAATANLTGALDLYRSLGYLFGEAGALTDMGVVQRVTGDYRAAVGNHTHAIELYRSLGYQIGEANALNNLGFVQYLTGDHAAATASLTRALELCRSLGYRIGEANALTDISILQRLTGNYPAAAATQAQALELCRSLGYQIGEANALNNLGFVQYLTGDHAAATASLTRALERCRSLGYRIGEAEALNTMGEVSLASNPGEARAFFEAALAISTDIAAIPEKARALEGIGRSYVEGGDNIKAAAHLHEALAIYRRIGSGRAKQIDHLAKKEA